MTTGDLREELDMMQLSDSFFPAGLFAVSNGIESMYTDGAITTARQLEDLCGTLLERQVGPCDCVALARAYDCAVSSDLPGVADADAVCVSYKTVRETRDAAVRSGVQLARCVRGFQDGDVLDWYCRSITGRAVSGVYPVSSGVCCAALGMGRDRALLMLLYGFVVSSVGAALRLGMIQHFDAQGIIHRLKPSMLRAARDSSGADIHEMWQFAPQAEINQMRHERLDSKMFIT